MVVQTMQMLYCVRYSDRAMSQNARKHLNIIVIMIGEMNHSLDIAINNFCDVH